MKPTDLKTKIFLDSGDPLETKEILSLLGFLDGQTTNPSLISRNPEIQERIKNGEKISMDDLYNFYKGVVNEISNSIPQGSVSVEVYSDKNTPASEMINQAKIMNSWIPNAHIKLPCITEGMKALETLTNEGLRINMTLCFTQDQAGAVYAASLESGRNDVYVSPFQGRLEDNCKDGTDLVMNIQRMYAKGDGHVKVLVASIRDLPHFLYALYSKPDIVTVPFKVLKEWAEQGLPIPGKDIDEAIFKDKASYFKGIQNECVVGVNYKDLDLSQPWQSFDLASPLTDQGLEKFSSDWNKLINITE